ncbi:MAG: heparin lyase I family protein [Candidatus Melainabacteria bacterium]|nr:heparin lyase I family protein [Candidatus Melainabacteria bacterium]
MQDKTRLAIVQKPVRIGPGAARLTVHPQDIAAKRNRAEINVVHGEGLNSDVWYAWSILVPRDYCDDYSNQRFQIMGQFHDMPDFAKGQSWKGFPVHPPMISIQYGYDKTGSGFGLFYGLDTNRKRIAKRYIQKGIWHDIVLHIRWSQGSDGFVEAGLDGSPWTPFNGRDHKYYAANMYNAAPPMLKLGIYRDFGFTTINSVFYDELRIGPTKASIESPALTK